MVDLHEVVFRWPYGGQDVIVTGTFDQWSSSVHLTKTPTGFEGTVRVPWSQKIYYKYIVDGRWRTTDQAPTEDDGFGGSNNVYHTPNEPVSSTIVNGLPMGAANESQVGELSSSEVQDLANGSSMVQVNDSQEDTPLVAVKEDADVSALTESPTNEAPIVQDEAIPLVTKKPTEEHLVPFVEPKTEVETVEPAIEVESTIQLPEPETKTTELSQTAAQPVAPKFSMPVVPVNDGQLVSEPLVASPNASQPDSTLSTHTPIVNPRRSASVSSPMVSQPDTINGGNDENGNTGTVTSPSASITPQKQAFPSSSGPDSPVSPSTGSLRSSKQGSVKGSGIRPKRNSIFGKLKTMFSPDKDKEKQNGK